ncbi:nicotinamide riboside transporter PnuC [Amniculibacterium aquaticum]|uniref:nicotinamide riboside transporter PnuC n=1 Tax=Amniculibacterium aquaticum TaxID=2479858 RepID=UPI000F597144|nr:nicotinamide riboside transporter PnuC [Amniculibacterium aquaticum]
MMQDIFLKTTIFEWLGVILSIFQVLLARKNYVHNYLFGIAGIVLSMLVMFRAKLYAEFTLNIYYLVMSIYGWLFWKFGKEKTEVAISQTNHSEKLKAGGIVVLSFGIFYYFLTHFTNSDVPIWDSLVSAFAWSGMWLMAKRKIENWILLNVSNIISIPLMFHKDLYLYGLFSIFLFCAGVAGYLHWKKLLLKPQYA